MEENGRGTRETRAAHGVPLTRGKGEDGKHATTPPQSKLSFSVSKSGGVRGNKMTKVKARSWVRVSLFKEPLHGGGGS